MDKLMYRSGGEPLPGSPETWEQAKGWTDQANQDKDEFSDPQWKWDCGFKLDFDGPLMSIESRFYPPAAYNGPKWNGSLRVRLGSDQVHEKKFECETFDQLTKEVESHVAGIKQRISNHLKDIF